MDKRNEITELTLDQMDKVTGGTNNYEMLFYSLPTPKSPEEKMQESTLPNLLNGTYEVQPPL